MSSQPSVTAVLRATCSALLCHHSFMKYHLLCHHDPDALPILLQSLLSLPHWPFSLPPKSLRIVDGPCHSWIVFSSLSGWFCQSSSIKYASTIKLMSWCSFPSQKKVTYSSMVPHLGLYCYPPRASARGPEATNDTHFPFLPPMWLASKLALY